MRPSTSVNRNPVVSHQKLWLLSVLRGTGGAIPPVYSPQFGYSQKNANTLLTSPIPRQGVSQILRSWIYLLFSTITTKLRVSLDGLSAEETFLHPAVEFLLM